MLAPSKMPNGMRAARLLAVADTIEANARHFDMQAWDCCIAGMTVVHATGSQRHDTRDFAKDYLDLSDDEARNLFSPDPHLLNRYPNEPSVRTHLIDARWAAATVRLLAISGNIDWIAARKQARADEIENAMRAPTVRRVFRLRSAIPLSADEAELMAPVDIETELVPA